MKFRGAFELGESKPGLNIDFAADGQAVGIESTTSERLSLAAFDAVLHEFGHAPAGEASLDIKSPNAA